jgi:hypothetical protein
LPSRSHHHFEGARRSKECCGSLDRRRLCFWLCAACGGPTTPTHTLICTQNLTINDTYRVSLIERDELAGGFPSVTGGGAQKASVTRLVVNRLESDTKCPSGFSAHIQAPSGKRITISEAAGGCQGPSLSTLGPVRALRESFEVEGFGGEPAFGEWLMVISPNGTHCRVATLNNCNGGANSFFGQLFWDISPTFKITTEITGTSSSGACSPDRVDGPHRSWF